MNRIRRNLALVLAFAFVSSAHAQTDPISEAVAGVSSSFHPWVHDAIDYAGNIVGEFRQESIRLHWLANSDIRMLMVAHNEGTGAGIKVILPNLYMKEAPSDDELYAEFDWQNEAMSMIGHSSASKSSLGLFLTNGDGGSVGTELLDTSSEKTIFKMYFDAGGNVYVPADPTNYMKVNMGDFMQGMFDALEIGIEVAVELHLTRVMDYILVDLARLVGAGDVDLSLLGGYLSDDFFQQNGIDDWDTQLSYNSDTNTFDFDFAAESVIESRLREALRELVQSRLELVSHFPLVNFAFLASPTLVRAEANNRGVSFREELGTWLGQDGAIRITLTSGNDAGYVFVFDRYNRLALLQDTDGSWASYGYDSDVTVQLPANIVTIQDLMRQNAP